MGTFSLQLAEFAKKAGDNASLVTRKVALDLLTRVIYRSPVGNPDNWKHPAPPGYSGGQFRANWQVTIGAPATGSITGEDKDGQKTIADGEQKLVSFQVGPSIFITNTLAYGPRLEYEGWSSQAPAGMVRISVAEFETVVARALGEIEK